MPKLLQRFKAEVPFMDGTVTFTLRQPTNEEVNDYYAAQSRIVGQTDMGEERSRQFNALMAGMFDTVLEGIDDLTNGDGGPVGVEDKGKIPLQLKLPVVMKLGLDIGEVKIKN